MTQNIDIKSMMVVMKSSMVKIINTLLILDIGIVIFIYLSGDIVWFINAQIGFISSSLVVLATFISYKSMVEKRVEAGDISDLDRDTVDKIEDPYHLYDENHGDSIDKTIENEKDIQKKRKLSVKEALKNSRASLSIHRLLAYAILVIGFLYLTRTSQLDIIPYIFAISLPPIVILYF